MTDDGNGRGAPRDRAGLVAFLRARLDEDEQRAKEAMTPGVYRWVDIHPDLEWVITQLEGDFAEALPKRILAEVEAKRVFLDAWLKVEAQRRPFESPDYRTGVIDGRSEALREALHALAAVYRDHPDYDPGWAS